ncbi:alanine racemase [Mariprofundus aestuarium]|uniref:Alanine racemase n=1 Tax=Mariprofundus aestuarium TaxID=1921086 RepID=A0A2K8L5P8_MARES|nr:alanine racemase [Mariprofundus aestuarium]ATX80304.1 alanine racemase [Mariprofundus aestuarium]
MSRPAIAQINLDHLRHNYRLLNQRVGQSEIMAVVKANAYGHDQSLVGPILLEEGCRSFGVTDATEGSELRAIIGKHNSTEITLLSGVFDAEDAGLCLDCRLTPAITELNQIELLTKAGFNGDIWLKFDSGMNRLGAADPATLFSLVSDAGLHVHGFMSHLACADEPEHPMNLAQAKNFFETCNLISPDTPKSLLNSAGLISLQDYAFDVVRPGIALYGAEPVPDQPFGLKPVMSLTGEVMQIREVQAGASVSYGATFISEKTMKVAVVSMGYADGIPRPLSNQGAVYIRGEKHPIIGRVCMDYTMVDISNSEVQPGDSVEFWGEHISTNEVAAEIGTISYTLFTGVGERVRRQAV